MLITRLEHLVKLKETTIVLPSELFEETLEQNINSEMQNLREQKVLVLGAVQNDHRDKLRMQGMFPQNNPHEHTVLRNLLQALEQHNLLMVQVEEAQVLHQVEDQLLLEHHLTEVE